MSTENNPSQNRSASHHFESTFVNDYIQPQSKKHIQMSSSDDSSNQITSSFSPKPKTMSYTSNLAFRRADSAELSNIDISSPKRQTYPRTWKCCCRCSAFLLYDEWENRISTIVKAAIHGNQTKDIPISFLVCHSWLLSLRAYLIIRTILFIYLLISFSLLTLKGWLSRQPISMGIYTQQLFMAMFCVVCSSLVLVRKSRGQTGWFLHALHETCISLVQNTTAVVLAWDVVFWSVRQDVPIGLDTLILHCWNLVPVGFELVFGAAVYKGKYFLPGIFATGITIIAATAVWRFLTNGGQYTGNFETVWNGLVFAARNDSLFAKPVLHIFSVYLVACMAVVFTQRMRQEILRSC